MKDSDPILLVPSTSHTAATHQPDPRSALPAVMLLVVNLVPAIGVLFAGWSLLEVVALYWFENVVIGAINVLKMITCAPDRQHLQGMNTSADRENDSPLPDAMGSARYSAVGHHAVKLFFIPFFIVHYGIFCTVHGVFIFLMLGGKGPGGFGGDFSLLAMVAEILSGGMKYAALALIASHLISFVHHFLVRGEFRRTNVALLMAAPYARIVLLHISILFGAFAIHLLGQPMVLLILLIAGKTWLDWMMNVRAHGKLAGVPATK